MLAAIMDKIAQGQMGNISRKMEILRTNQKDMLGRKTTITETKNVFIGLTGVTKRKNLSASRSIESLKVKKQKTKIENKQTNPE